MENIKNIIVEIKEIEKHNIKDNITLEDLGIDSLDIALILFEIESFYDVEITLEKNDTVKSIYKKILSKNKNV